MENILKTAYMRSFATDYIENHQTAGKFEILPPKAQRTPPAWTSFFREKNQLPVRYPVTLDFIPSDCWKLRKGLNRKPIKLGNGTYGHVYKGILTPTNEKVAIKMLEKVPMVKMAAINEALIMRYLEQTSYVPKCHGIINWNTDTPAIAMEYLKGYKTINGLLFHSHGDIFDRVRLLKLALEIATAVNSLHVRHVHHNDLKYDNIMVNMTNPDSPQIKIIDFGLASYKCSRRKERQGLKRIYVDSFVAPEVQAGESTTAGSDIFSLGKVLRVLSMGRNLEIPELKKLTKDCCSRKPGARPTMAVVLQEIRDILKKYSS